MKQIKVTLMGVPTVTINNTPVKFPYNKAAGLFYYLCVRTTVSREEGASIFWANSDEKTARKNLRDVIYKIKKIFGDDILETEGNTAIKLNKQHNIEIDIEKINEDNIVERYTGEFLSHFYIKDCREFENWCENVRLYFREMYMAGLYKQLHNAAAEKNITVIKECAAILIDNDIYDEEMYRKIIQVYSHNGNYNLAIKTYYKLKEVLHEDLGEEPAKETKMLFENILMLKESEQDAKDSKEDYFYGRFEEVFLATKYLKQFADRFSKSIIISGEAGVGKTAILNKLVGLIDKSCVVLKYTCRYPEREFYFKAWYSLLENIEELLERNDEDFTLQQRFLNEYLEQPSNTENQLDAAKLETSKTANLKAFAIGDAMLKLTRKKKTVLIIDDLQWLDTASLKLLCSFILDLGNDRFMLLAAHRNNYSKELNDFFIALEHEDYIERIPLGLFSLEESREIIKDIAPEMLNDNTVKNIYKETEGNALFLTELIEAIQHNGMLFDFLSPKTINVIESRLLELNKEENNLVDAIALFQGGASMSDLKIVLPMAEFDIFEIIESLIAKKLIKEKAMYKDVFFLFNHQKFQEYILNRQSIAKRAALHNKIAKKYEQDFIIKRKMHLYSKLIYHFKEGANNYKSYFYKIEYLKEYYYTFQETFPHLRMLDIESEEHRGTDFAEETLIELVKEIKANSDGSEKYMALEMQVYFVIGRYCIYAGKYEEGLANINKSLAIAKKINDYEYLFSNYKQHIYYAVQVSDFEVMKKYLDICSQTIDKLKHPEKEDHVLFRLIGLYLIETGYVEEAQDILQNTIIMIKDNAQSKDLTIDLAVCYNYLGTCFMYKKLWQTAYEYFLKAIDICNKTVITNSIGIFNSNAAHALYELGEYNEAKKYNDIAINSFARTKVLWGRAKAEIYASLIELKLGNHEAAKAYFEKAKKTSTKLNNPKHLKQIKDLEELFIN